jgi:hypothetical protein
LKEALQLIKERMIVMKQVYWSRINLEVLIDMEVFVQWRHSDCIGE